MVIWIAPVEGKQNWLCNMSQGDYLINYSNWKGKGIGGYILMAFKCCYNYNINIHWKVLFSYYWSFIYVFWLWIMYKGSLQPLSEVYKVTYNFWCIHVSFKNKWCVNLIIFHIQVHKMFWSFQFYHKMPVSIMLRLDLLRRIMRSYCPRTIMSKLLPQSLYKGHIIYIS